MFKKKRDVGCADKFCFHENKNKFMYFVLLNIFSELCLKRRFIKTIKSKVINFQHI
jgi:hypothetical protein